MRSWGMDEAKVAVKRVFTSLDDRFRGCAGVPTGIPMLDAVGGMRVSELVVLAGHPGVGKTSLAIAITSHAARDGVPVLWLSLGETIVQTAERLLLGQTGTSPAALRIGNLQRQDMIELTHAAAAISKWPLQIEDALDMTAAGICECARGWRASETGPRALIVVDCLQLLADDCDSAAVLRSLLGTAKETRSALLLVSQHVADARERAMLEGIATAVVYLRAETHAHEIVLAKHRYCQVPQIEEVQFDGARFMALEPALPHVGQAGG